MTIATDEGTTGEPTAETTADGGGPSGVGILLVFVAIGAAVSLSLGVYGNIHDPTGDDITTFGFPDVLSMKAWLATGVAMLALAQVATALWMWDRLPGVSSPAPRWAVHGHRWLGTVAFLVSLPVAYHCLWALGFQDTNGRVLVHSLLGWKVVIAENRLDRLERLRRGAIVILERLAESTGSPPPER